MRFRSTNPVYSRINKMNTYSDVTYAQATYLGVAGKTLYYMAMVVVGAFLGILMLFNRPDLIPYLGLSIVVAFIAALVAFISPRASMVAGTIYCLAEGAVVGIVSLIFEALLPGVVVLALLGTVMVVIVAAGLFLTGIVKVNSKFMRFLTIFAISVLATLLVSFLLGLIFPETFAIMNNPTVSIIISVVMIFLATLYIMFDLENIRQVVEGNQPKFMEWFAAFGLAFTVIWLYMEILPLVFQILARDS